MSTLRVTKGSKPKFKIEVFQAEEDGPRLDLTSAVPLIVESNLPFEPVVTLTDAEQGELEVSFPDTDNVRTQYSYSFRIEITDDFTTPKIRVWFI